MNDFNFDTWDEQQEKIAELEKALARYKEEYGKLRRAGAKLLADARAVALENSVLRGKLALAHADKAKVLESLHKPAKTI